MCFSGPPGTGKTLTAKAIANSLRKKLMVVDYSKLYDKYVGESEKSVSGIFKTAKKTKSVLFFD